MKETLQDQRNVNGIFRGKCEDALRKADAIILAQDSTHRSDSTLIVNKTGLLDDCTRQYKDLDRRTMPKGTSWVLVAIAFALGVLAAK